MTLPQRKPALLQPLHCTALGTLKLRTIVLLDGAPLPARINVENLAVVPYGCTSDLSDGVVHTLCTRARPSVLTSRQQQRGKMG